MIYRKFNDGDKEHSLLGYGAMRMPTNEDKTIKYDEAAALIHKAYEAGVTYFDTAYVYHEQKSEEFLGKALAKYPRESYFVATKLPIWQVTSYDDLDGILEEHLRRLNMDYIDYYLVHALNKTTVKAVRDHNVIDWLKEKKAQGKIRHICFSFHDEPSCLEDIVTMYDWDFAQLQINYADWNNNDGKTVYDIATKAGIPVVVMEPVRGGMLANPAPEVANILKEAAPDKSCASWAMKYVASLPNVKLILSGMSTMDQVVDNLATFESEESIALSDSESAVIDKAMDILDNLKSVLCTDCKYCMPCPFGVDIPGCFSVYNKAKIFGHANYDSLEDDAKADKCIACGQCVNLCPQKIEIPDRLVEVKDYFAN